jgi:hypothetical protein
MITVYGTNTSGAGQRGRAQYTGDHVDAAKPTGARGRSWLRAVVEIHW